MVIFFVVTFFKIYSLINGANDIFFLYTYICKIIKMFIKLPFIPRFIFMIIVYCKLKNIHIFSLILFQMLN